jgi:hypothetical protein
MKKNKNRITAIEIILMITVASIAIGISLLTIHILNLITK